jgi:uncharacterized protein YciI
MAYFYLRLNRMSPTSPQDLSDAERQVMREHVAYWTGQVEKGSMLLFGPVLDPNGPWGVGILEAENEEAARLLTLDDPAVIAGTHSTDILPMAAVVKK